MEAPSSVNGEKPKPLRDNADADKPATTTQAPPATPGNGTKPERPPPILCLGMARTGTASLCAALRTLGLAKVHHGTETVFTDDFLPQWAALSRAADATFPNLPTYRGTPFTRAEWDEVFGEYDAVTDVASFYATSLIRAYPDAKVILVERDVDKWFTSITPVFEPMSKGWFQKMVRAVDKRTGSLAGTVSIKFQMGWTGATKPEEMMTKAKEAYARHYKEIREFVPKEQLLEFKLADGWEPLCKFLGKDVPDGPFPHLNDAAAWKKHEKEAAKVQWKKLARTAVPFRKKAKKEAV